VSHTTTIKSIVINSKEALVAAVRELNQQGIICNLKENSVPRAYYKGQTGMEKADLVLTLTQAPYDIGLYKQTNGEYELRTDFWGGHVEKLLSSHASSEDRTPETKVQAKLGKLYQSYAANAAEIAAQNQGYQTQRVNAKDGSMQIVVTGY
jgi:hypothetical protein